ncbi:hypothetical protein C0995_016360 [Termitomyces sp. Mi166|nr:hypothetical protein C0995_016360 [Termitomyces sp. Mi166\
MKEIAADSSAIRDAIAAGQAKATTVPLRESDGDDATVHALQDVSVEIPAFQGFEDFELDLTCLSPPTSPPGSIYEDARSITPSVSPRHSISLSFRSPSPTQSRRSKVSQAKSASPLLPNSSGTSVPRGSWPLVRYVGRGTPIDKNRRIEWGGTSNESDDVGEDGVLFTTVRSTSLDSTAHPSQRSASPEWNVLSRHSSTVPARTKSRSLRTHPPTPSPAIQIEGLGSENPGEWASFVHTVLGESSSSATASTSQPSEPAAPLPPAIEEPDEEKAEPTMTPEEIQQLDAELGIDLGIDGALDLGLGYRGGMNWFNLGMLPGSGRASPSVYSSQAPTSPQPSRPPSVTVTPQDNRSTASIKVGGDTRQSIQTKSTKSSSPVWWRRILHRLKKVPLLMVGSR